MITIPKSLGFLINSVGIVSKKTAARVALYLFTTPRNGQITPKQSKFLKSAVSKTLFFEDYQINTYTWKGSGPTILLAHGWESNSGRWHFLIKDMQDLNYNIVALDAPAHGNSGSKRFNAILYANFMQVVSNHYHPDIVIGHSVGGMAAVYAQTKLKSANVKKMVLLGTPTKFEGVINRYYHMMGFSERTKQATNKHIETVFNVAPKNFSTAQFSKQLAIKSLIIHDNKDRVIPYADAIELHANLTNSTLITTSGFGHSLKDRSISDHILTFLKG
ncbi:alpha/beta fold hydrolase [Bizionia sediminis]|uniref:Alpha/beta fold hydrolase n=1 Tax=Bizionia sediminis TaxID=1737064 RepID=A0ABW5KMJ7_9FLAO